MKAIYLFFIFATVGFCANEKLIWDFLLSKIGNKKGVAGLMGNLQAESGLKSVCLQLSSAKKLGMDAETYTSKVDKGSYLNFDKDSAGYGIAQWTSKDRKKALRDFALSRKVSVGDLNMQLEFLVKELKANYAMVWKTLTKAKTVKIASDAVVLKFERPADTSKKALNQRLDLANKLYSSLCNSTADDKEKKEEEVVVAPKNDRRMCKEFWDQYSKTNYPTREQYVEGMQKVIGPKINYTQGSQRWSGIKNKTCPPSPPSYTDCSAFTTWGFWTAFGGLDDIINGSNWSAGYTGSMQTKGKKVSSTSNGCEPGDVILYPGHVALYIGNNQVLNYGSTGPAKILKYNYKGITGCYRYNLPFGEPL